MNNYDALIKATLAGTSFSHLVALASDYLSNPLVVIDNSLHIIAYSKNRVSTDFIWLEAVSRGYITIEFGATLNNWDDLVSQDQDFFDVHEISSKVRRFIRLEYQHRMVGYLNILEETTPLDSLPDETYHFVAALLTKELLFNYQQLNLQPFCLREEEILLELLQERFVDHLHFTSRIQGCSLDQPFTFHVGCIDFTHFISYNAKHSLIQESLQAYIPDSTSVFFNNQLVILVKSEKEIKKQPLNQFLKSMNLLLGISDPFEDLYILNTYLKQAQAALRLNPLLSPAVQITLYDKVKPYHMYERFSTDELLQFCHQHVLTLKRYDEKNETEYVKTLQTYLLYQKSIQKTAACLYVHRNTIHYRIARIKEILQFDLDNSEQDARMLQSCEILEYIHFRHKPAPYKQKNAR